MSQACSRGGGGGGGGGIWGVRSNPLDSETYNTNTYKSGSGYSYPI